METLENNYLVAAIDALNKVVTSDVSPRLASKIVRFRQILSNYAATAENATNGEGAKDANGNEIADVYTV